MIMPGNELTTREIEIVQALVDADGNLFGVCRRYHLSASTVKTHLSNIANKINSKSRLHTVLICIRAGLVKVTEETPTT